MSILKASLPKWPAIVVQGKPVTREQAAEIIIRCGYFLEYQNTNDARWEATMRRIMGFPKDVEGEATEVGWARMDARNLMLGRVTLGYLSLHRVASCYVGGPHGWVDWNGEVFCNNYNIGKWPSVLTVRDEWRAIAKVFPYLDLTCQLFNYEHCEVYDVEDFAPVVEYRVKDGRVRTRKPGKPMEVDPHTTYDFMQPGRERGCTADELAWAINITEKRVAQERKERYGDDLV